MVTTDKVYQNREWAHGYRESDRLGGHDPYSASKAGAEIAIDSWRSSFCGPGLHQTPFLRIASARAGNVIGGGDWAADRIVPDAIRSLVNVLFETLQPHAHGSTLLSHLLATCGLPRFSREMPSPLASPLILVPVWPAIDPWAT